MAAIGALPFNYYCSKRSFERISSVLLTWFHSMQKCMAIIIINHIRQWVYNTVQCICIVHDACWKWHPLQLIFYTPFYFLISDIWFYDVMILYFYSFYYMLLSLMVLFFLYPFKAHFSFISFFFKLSALYSTSLLLLFICMISL